MTANGVIGVLRIRQAVAGGDQLRLVGNAVVVRVVTFINLKVKHLVSHGQQRNIRSRPEKHTAEFVEPRGNTVGVRGIGQPSGRRIGVGVIWSRCVRLEFLLKVPQPVRIRIRFRHARKPRILHKVHWGVAAPIVVEPIDRERAVPNVGASHAVVQPIGTDTLAQNRIEAMVHLVEIVHAVQVGVFVARIGRHIELACAERQHDPEIGVCIAPRESRAVPGVGNFVEQTALRKRNIHGLPGQTRERYTGQHPIRRHIVTEAAHGLHPVLLIVQETVVIPILRVVREGSVHAVGDRHGRVCNGVRRQGSRKLHFPSVGQTVTVGVDRTRVESAALRAGSEVIRFRAVDKGLLGRIAQTVAVRICDPRVARPELVDPRGVDGRDGHNANHVRSVVHRRVRVGRGRIGARKLAAVGQTIAQGYNGMIDVAVERVPRRNGHRAVGLYHQIHRRIDRDVQLPPVGHAVVRDRRSVAVGRQRIRGKRLPRYRIGRHRIRGSVHAVLAHELHQQILVLRREGLGVLRRCEPSRPPLRMLDVVQGHGPRGSRIKAEFAQNLVVHDDGVRVDHADDQRVRGQSDRTANRDRRAGVRVAVEIPRCKRTRVRRYARANGQIRVGLGAALNHGHQLAAHAGIGHVIAVRIVFGCQRAVGGFARIHAAHQFPRVADAIAVGVPIDGIGADDHFLEVRQPVLVGVLRRGSDRRNVITRTHRRAGNKVQADGLRFDQLSVRDVVGIVLGARHPLESRVVPEIELEAVGQAVAIRIFQRRIGVRLILVAVRVAHVCQVQAGMIAAHLEERREVVSAVAVGNGAEVEHAEPTGRIEGQVIAHHRARGIGILVVAAQIGHADGQRARRGRVRRAARGAFGFDGNGGLVGNAVLVDVAEVILDAPLAAEDRLHVADLHALGCGAGRGRLRRRQLDGRG